MLFRSTQEPYQILNNIVLDTSYHITLKHLTGQYVSTEATLKPFSVGELLTVMMKTKPRNTSNLGMMSI